MCSVTDIDEDGVALMVPETRLDSCDVFCRKCQKEARVVLRKKDVYCKECFLATCTHKFRATLGKSKIMKIRDKVLVAFSGSQSSVALLHFLRSGLDEDQHKKLFFNVVVCYIEEGSIFDMAEDERINLVEKMGQIVESFKFEFFIASLSESMTSSVKLYTIDNFVINKQNDIKISQLFKSIKSITSKEDMIAQLRHNVFTHVAESLQCNKIFTAEIGNDLAVRLLSDISLGRGNQLPLQVGFCDFRHKNIKLLRPLREFTKKEISYYNLFCELEAIITPSFSTLQSSNVSVQKLTEKFITELQEEFPSTVYTIFRTGDKLSMDESSLADNDKICLLCKGVISDCKEEYDAVKDTQFSKQVSEGKEDRVRSSEICSPCNGEKSKGECCGSCGTKEMIWEKCDIEKYFCYGCNLIIRDMDDVENLPQDVLAAAKERKNFEVMKNQISDFLI